MDPFGMTPAQYAAGAAWATFAVLVLTAAYAARQVRETKALRREQFRPWVMVDLEFSRTLVYVVIENVGSTVARDVEVRFDPPLSGVLDIPDYMRDLKLFRDPIPNMPPSRRYRLLLDQFPQRVKSDLPMTYTAMVRYKDHRGRPLPDEKYILDMDLQRGLPRDPKGIPDIAEAVIDIRKQLTTWAHPRGGLLTWQVHAEAHERRTDRPMVLLKALRAKDESGWRGMFHYLAELLQRRHGLYVPDLPRPKKKG